MAVSCKHKLKCSFDLQVTAGPCCCRGLPADHVFGVPSKHEGHSVSALLKGDYTQEQLDADSDLGKSVKEGWRNIGPAGRVSNTASPPPPPPPHKPLLGAGTAFGQSRASHYPRLTA